MFLAYRKERLDAVTAQIRIHSREIHVERFTGQMPSRICFGCRADVASLDISYDDQPLGPAVFDSPAVSDHSGDPELLVHGHLRLHGRHDIAYGVDDALVELIDRFSGDHIFLLEILGDLPAVSFRFSPCVFQDGSRNEREVGVKSHYYRSVLGQNGVNQFLYHFDPFSYTSVNKV